MAKKLICTLLVQNVALKARWGESSWVGPRASCRISAHVSSEIFHGDRKIGFLQSQDWIFAIHRVYLLSHRLICNYGDGMITSAADENNWHTWKRLWLGQKSSTLQDLSRLYLWHTWMRWLRGTSWYFIIHNHNHWLCAIFQKVNFDRAADSTTCRKLLSSRS